MKIKELERYIKYDNKTHTYYCDIKREGIRINFRNIKTKAAILKKENSI